MLRDRRRGYAQVGSIDWWGTRHGAGRKNVYFRKNVEKASEVREQLGNG